MQKTVFSFILFHFIGHPHPLIETGGKKNYTGCFDDNWSNFLSLGVLQIGLSGFICGLQCLCFREAGM